MKSAYLLVLLFMANYCFAQSYKWANSFGGKLKEKGTSICVDTKGNFFVCGSFTSPNISFGNYTLTNKSTNENSDMFIVKYDATGNVLWAVSAGGDADERPKGICCDLKGNCYVTGYTESKSVQFGNEYLKAKNPSFSSSDIFIAKYDVEGKLAI